MNHYSFDEIAIGHKESFETEITPDYMDAFRQFTGDINPLHRDAEFARSKGFDSVVVFGMLVASYYSTLAGVYLPGEKSLIHSVEVQFAKPAFPNDKIYVEGTVTEKDERFNLLTIKCSISRIGTDSKIKLSRAIMKVGVV